jgi:hypothetical protein
MRVGNGGSLVTCPSVVLSTNKNKRCSVFSHKGNFWKSRFHSLALKPAAAENAASDENTAMSALLHLTKARPRGPGGRARPSREHLRKTVLVPVVFADEPSPTPSPRSASPTQRDSAGGEATSRPAAAPRPQPRARAVRDSLLCFSLVSSWVYISYVHMCVRVCCHL